MPTLSTPRSSRPPHSRHGLIDQPATPASPFSPHISSEYILVIAQSFPQLPPLRPEVATLLAQNTEFYLRHIVRLAKMHMRHSKSFRLCVRHVELALTSSAGTGFCHPLSLGYLSSDHPPEFKSVHACPGLFIRDEPSVSLSQILYCPIARKRSNSHVVSSSLIVPYKAILNDGARLALQSSSNHPVSQLIAALSSTSSQQFHLDHALLSLSAMPAPPLQPLLSAMRGAVRTHAQTNGQTKLLHLVLRIVLALTTNPLCFVNVFEDTILSIILTCLLAPNLGCGDTHALRQVAADILFSFLMFTSNDNDVYKRVCNTLCATLTDRHSTLETIYGSIMGLAVINPSAFRSHFLPHMPHLLHALEQLLSSTSQLPVSHDVSHGLQCTITKLSYAIQRAMLVTHCVLPENEIIDVNL